MRSILKMLMLSALLLAAVAASAMQVNPGFRPESGTLDAIEIPQLVANQGNGPTLSQAVEQVKRQYKGRIVSAKTKMKGNQEVHEIKVLTEDGKVKTVRVPGRRRN